MTDHNNGIIKILGIDLVKQSFQLHGIDENGQVVLRKKLSRCKLSAFMANLPSCLIGLEACGGSHYWVGVFKAMGHDVCLIAPQFVKPYVKSNKNDSVDAEAICEAGKRHLNFASFTTKERLNFPVATHYHVDIITHENFLTGKLNADWWQILKAVFQSRHRYRLRSRIMPTHLPWLWVSMYKCVFDPCP